MERKPASLPPAAFAGITGVLILIVIGMLGKMLKIAPTFKVTGSAVDVNSSFHLLATKPQPNAVSN
jgi:hypothetical protein